jgi:hypothetical protein
MEYLIDLLMRGPGVRGDEVEPARAPTALSAPSRQTERKGATEREDQPQRGRRKAGWPWARNLKGEHPRGREYVMRRPSGGSCPGTTQEPEREAGSARGQEQGKFT